MMTSISMTFTDLGRLLSVFNELTDFTNDPTYPRF